MKELCNVGMLDGPVNFDFTHQLLLRSTPLKRGLLNNFGRAHCLGVHLYELVALGEATLSEKLAFDILPVAHFTICVLYALLDQLGCWVACIGPSGWMKVCLTSAVGVA
jgi:hypothetical protein